ncbi:ChaN family lipoprotein [Belliella pelovolcani]|uniref:ChaN family lipoprotein n=1 Tax=Belliella pelovolcani TaxID=529505 RepID=UPI003919F8A6
MTRILTLLSFFIFVTNFLNAQISTHQVFDKEGKTATIEQILEASSSSELIFFGELHNNSIAHWLQLQLLKSLHQSRADLVLAGEFFERDDQLNINEWFSGKITDKNFEAEAKLWNNYSTDYKPLMLYAKQNNIPFIASNIPRKYASLVSRDGLTALEELSQEAKAFIAPLPIVIDKDLPGYVGMKNMMHGSGMNVDYMVEAQAIKDATMAYSLYDAVEKKQQIYHINGSYHSNNYEGIVWYIKQMYPEAKILTIATVEQNDISNLEDASIGIADFIFVLPSDSPKSY